MPDLKQDIRRFITENFLFGQSKDGFTDEASLMELGIIDSTGVLEIVAHLESTYELKVKDEDLVPGNFDSVVGLAKYLEGMLEEAGKPVRSSP
jgi:acyl carrier protein